MFVCIILHLEEVPKGTYESRLEARSSTTVGTQPISRTDIGTMETINDSQSPQKPHGEWARQGNAGRPPRDHRTSHGDANQHTLFWHGLWTVGVTLWRQYVHGNPSSSGPTAVQTKLKYEIMPIGMDVT